MNYVRSQAEKPIKMAEWDCKSLATIIVPLFGRWHHFEKNILTCFSSGLIAEKWIFFSLKL